MDWMSPLDATFLHAEDEDEHVSMAIASIAVFEGPAPLFQDIVALLERGLTRMPRYRQKAREIPFDLGPPVWVDDPHFDIGNHVKHTAVPAPGSKNELRALMGRIMSQRLDRTRPLWDYWVVEGLADGHWALISKAHHCLVDGVAASNLYEVFLDASPERAAGPVDTLDPQAGTPNPDSWHPEPEPSTAALARSAAAHLALGPVREAQALRGALRHPRGLAHRTAHTAQGLGTFAEALRPAAASSLLGPIGRQRCWTWARVPFEDVRTVRAALGGTVNDVMLTAITGGFRALLLARGEEPRRDTIRTMVPVNVRAPRTEGIYENRVSMILAKLPTDQADPVTALAAVRAQMGQLKGRHEAEAGETVTTVAGYQPFPLVATGIRVACHLPQRSVVTVTTNVPGPRRLLYACGRRLVEVIPYVPISTTVRTGVAIVTYNGLVSFGVTGDLDSAADIDVLASGIENTMGELVNVASECARP